jgi:reductive dehalogenase
MEVKESSNISRRNFLKFGGLVGVAAQAVSIPAIAYMHGKDPKTHTGWESYSGATQYMNRKPYEIKSVDELYTKWFTKEGKIERPNNMVDNAMGRAVNCAMKAFMKKGFKVEDGPGALGLPKEFIEYYKTWLKNGQDRFKTDFELGTKTMHQHGVNNRKYGAHLALSHAFFDGGWLNNALIPEEITEPPDVWDFQYRTNMGMKLVDLRKENAEREKRGELLKFRSPDLAAKLVKKITHKYGATIVGIAKFNPDYTYKVIRGLSAPTGGMAAIFSARPLPYGKVDPVPKHWKYIIVFGVPHEWDQVVSNPVYGDSLDAYTRCRTTGIRLTDFLKHLGYSARYHVPIASYDIMVPPYAVEAGIGQFSRMGTVISPETGGNIRLGAVTTDLEMTVDKPIDFGVDEFCRKCKICAEICPSGSISFEDEPPNVVRGIRHWDINTATCAQYWFKTIGPLGCRLCIAACPFSRKSNWVHGVARAFDPLDPTGLMKDTLIWMQKTFWKAPKADEYLPPPDGNWASYRPAPEWLDSEKYFDINPPDPRKLKK